MKSICWLNSWLPKAGKQWRNVISCVVKKKIWKTKAFRWGVFEMNETILWDISSQVEWINSTSHLEHGNIYAALACSMRNWISFEMLSSYAESVVQDGMKLISLFMESSRRITFRSRDFMNQKSLLLNYAIWKGENLLCKLVRDCSCAWASKSLF